MRHQQSKSARKLTAFACGVLVSLSCAAPAAEKQHESADAMQICRSAGSERYADPANACWVAYEGAIERRDYATALDAVNAGCARYRRSDLCMFAADLTVNAQSI